jgi:glycosyltransferase involved in cell wall biosynthesis
VRSTPALVSVIVPVRDAASTLGAQFAALARQAYAGDWEVIVADNGSTDASVDVAEAWRDRLPDLRIVAASAGRGSAFARNRGASAAAGQFLAFCEADDEVTPGWLTGLVNAGRLYDLVGGHIDVVTLNDDVVRAWRGMPARDELLRKFKFLPIAVGANLGIWRSVLDAVGGWNETYRYQTDVELSFRVQLSSYRLGYAPDAVVRYRMRATLPSLARQAFRYGIVDAQLFRDFRHAGLERDHALKAWYEVAKRSPYLVISAKHRGRWIRLLSSRAGRLAGSARYRTYFP